MEEMKILTETSTDKIGLIFAIWAVLLVLYFAIYAYANKKQQMKLLAIKEKVKIRENNIDKSASGHMDV